MYILNIMENTERMLILFGVGFYIFEIFIYSRFFFSFFNRKKNEPLKKNTPVKREDVN